MEGALKSASGKSKKGTGLLLVSIGLVSTSLSALAGWFYLDLSQTQTELVATQTALVGEKQRAAALEGQVSKLTEEASGLKTQVSDLDKRNSSLQAEVNTVSQKFTQATQDLEDQEVISECMTAIVGAIALAETEGEFYALLLPYEAVCTEAVELMD